MNIFEIRSGEKTTSTTGFPPSEAELAHLNGLYGPGGIRFSLENNKLTIEIKQIGEYTISVLKETATRTRLTNEAFTSTALMEFSRVGQRVELMNLQNKMFFRVVSK